MNKNILKGKVHYAHLSRVEEQPQKIVATIVNGAHCSSIYSL